MFASKRSVDALSEKLDRLSAKVKSIVDLSERDFGLVHGILIDHGHRLETLEYPGRQGGSDPDPSSQPTIPTGQRTRMTTTLELTTQNSYSEYVNLLIDGPFDGIHSNNNERIRNIMMRDVEVRGARGGGSPDWETGYGAYFGLLDDSEFWNLHLSTDASSQQHGLRIAQGQNNLFDGLQADTRLSQKSAIWLVGTSLTTIRKSRVVGGSIRIGARPNDNQGEPELVDNTIEDTVIIKSSGGDQEAICAWPGIDGLVLRNLNITCPGNWLSVDSRRVKNVVWENVIWNGVPVIGFNGVKLGGFTEADAISRGIGAAGMIPVRR